MDKITQKNHLVVLAAIVLSTSLSVGQSSISASEAKRHVGENATVCGQVASTHFASSSRGRPTFINLDSAYPSQIFTVVIWGDDRAKFGNPEEKYGHKRICVTGPIGEYRGVPEQVAHDPSQVRVQ